MGVNRLTTLSTHWLQMKAARKRLHETDSSRIITGQLFTIVVALGAGLLLEQNKQAFLLIGTSLMLYPALADLLASNAAVLTSSLHHDIDETRGSRSANIFKSYVRAIIVAVCASAILGVLSGILGIIFFDAQFNEAVILAVAAGALTGALGFPLMIAVTLYARSKAVNPDDIIAPAESTVFSILTLVSIVIVSRLLQ